MSKENPSEKLLITRYPRGDYYLDKPETTVKSSTAYDMIRELIMSGEFFPGSRLVTAELEAKLGVGRGAIREALMRLDKSGLVQNIPYKGAVVAKLPSYKEIAYIYESRVLIECQLARESLEQITESDIAELEKLSENMLTFCKSNPFIFCHDREFHITLYKISNMPHLLGIIERLLDHVEVFLNTKQYPAEMITIFLEQHDQMLRAIKNRDADALCAALKANILSGLDLIHQEIEHVSQFRHWKAGDIKGFSPRNI